MWRWSHILTNVTAYKDTLNPAISRFRGIDLLYRVIFASEAVGSTGASLLSVAQILGVSMRNNARDHITSGVMFHDGWCLQAMEGARVDIDRLMRRIGEDRRHKNIRILVDRPIAARGLAEAMVLWEDPAVMLRTIGAADMASITAREAERIVELKLAA
jgi:hypothetical protein